MSCCFLAMTANFGTSSKTGETLTKGKSTMSYHNQTAEFIATVAQNMPMMSTDVMQGWIQNSKALKKLLSGLNPPVNGATAEFKVFKTIKLGTGIKDADGYRNAIKDNNMRTGNWANDILSKSAFSVATEETELDLVVVSVAELGFKNGAKLKDIFDRAKEKGLELCPNEVGPQLRLAYKDQPKDEWLVIGMEPIADSAGSLGLFYVGRSGNGLWLSAGYGSPGDFWVAGGRFVFVRSRK